MPSDIRVLLGTVAVSVMSWALRVAVVMPLCIPRP